MQFLVRYDTQLYFSDREADCVAFETYLTTQGINHYREYSSGFSLGEAALIKTLLLPATVSVTMSAGQLALSLSPCNIKGFDPLNCLINVYGMNFITLIANLQAKSS